MLKNACLHVCELYESTMCSAARCIFLQSSHIFTNLQSYGQYFSVLYIRRSPGSIFLCFSRYFKEYFVFLSAGGR